jgi:hypothetical protein
VGSKVNGSSLPHCSAAPVAAAFAERAFDRWIASEIICGVAEVGGGFLAAVDVVVGVDVAVDVWADADGPTTATAAAATAPAISFRDVYRCFIVFSCV